MELVSPSFLFYHTVFLFVCLFVYKMRAALPVLGLAAAVPSFGLAHPLEARQSSAAQNFETCKFGGATAFQSLQVSTAPAAHRKRKCSSRDKPDSTLSNTIASATTSISFAAAAHSQSGSTKTTVSSSKAITTKTAASSSKAAAATTTTTTKAAASSSKTAGTGTTAASSSAASSSAASSSAASCTSTSEWNPPSDMATALDEVWEHVMSTYSEPLEFKNYGYDHLMDTEANTQHRVRWDSTQSITADQLSRIETALECQYNKWVSLALAGFDGFPYTTASVQVVGFATNNTSLLSGTVTDGVTVYSITSDTAGVSECDPACGRAIHYADGDYSGCSGGDAARYDVSLWLTDGMDGSGLGGDWGQQVGTNCMLENLESENIHIVLHEMGHTLAVDDFYDCTPDGETSFIMLSGCATEVTEFDVWMVRDWWRYLKSRYNL
jgi:hypothetical protein